MNDPITTRGKEAADLVEALRRRAGEQPERRAYTFLEEGESESGHLTYRELDERARAVAAALQASARRGDRALLLFPPGLDFVAAFFGCLYAGVIAVPAYPPRSPRMMPRLRAMLADCRPALALTSLETLPRLRSWFEADPEIATVPWIATDALPPALAAEWRDPGIGPDDLAFLQYTSGSTGTPRGVMVSHGNLAHNQELIRRACGHSAESVFVSWLPVYHDLGLIGQVLQATWVGALCVLMAPVAFLQRPLRWLEAVSRYGATTSGGPNFAYDLCMRKAEGADLSRLDLSSWQVAFNGAEPVRAETLTRFAAALAGCGFRAEAPYPCYGLAEATLMVSGGIPAAPAVSTPFEAAALEAGRAERAEEGGRRLVGSGRPLGDQRVEIVDPESREPRPAGGVGEVWVAGGSVARGYWGRPEESETTFGARLGDGSGPFLRTGDLGFLLDGELYIAGRIKDLILLRGRNLYPQDIERTVEASHAALRAGGTAVFAVDSGQEERLVVVQEVERRVRSASPELLEEIAAAVRRAVADEHEAYVWDVVLVEPGGVPRTTSGKVQRRGCRALYLDGALSVVGQSTLETLPEEPPAADDDLLPALLAAGEAEKPRRAEAWLRHTFSRLARIDPSRVDPDRPLTSYGLDSLLAIELRNALAAAVGAEPPLAALLEGASLSDLVPLLSRPGAGPAPLPEAEEVFTAGEIPLSWGQRGLWFLHRLAPQGTAYHLAGAARLCGGVDPVRLRRALQGLVDRHAALRVTFAETAEGPVQRIAGALEVALREQDAADWSAAELRDHLVREAFQPFDLEQGPVFRAALFHREDESYLVLAVHHAVADFTSLAVLARELGDLYAGVPLLPPKAGWEAYVRHEERFLASPEGERLGELWRERLDGVEAPDLPVDRPGRGAAFAGTAVAAARLDAARLATVQALAREHGCTLFMALLGAFEALLARSTGQESFLVGAPTSGRFAERWSATVGYFVHPVALRADLADDPPGRELLARTRREALEAFDLAAYPFARLAECLRTERGPGATELLPALLALHKAPAPGMEALAAFALGEEGARLELNGLALESVALPPAAAQRDLTLQAAELDGGLALSLEVDAARFDAVTAERMLARFTRLLDALAADPARRVSELAVLAEEERLQILAEAAGPAAEVPEAPVQELVEQWAEREPDRLAVADPDGDVTYAELVRRASELAAHLRTMGVTPEAPVAVCAGRSAALVTGALGVLEAGGAYVPLDPSYPSERLGLVLEDLAQARGGPPLVLASREARRALPPGARLVPLEGPWPAKKRKRAARRKTPPQSLAYAIYTSGSTGRPKGVEIPHAGLANLVAWHRRAYGLGPDDRATLIASPGFDASVWEIWPYLASGASLHVPPEEVRTHPARLAAWLAETGITVAFLPTPLAEAVLDEPWPAGTALRALLTGGDKLHRPPRPGLPFRLINHYGPTESTVVATCGEAPPGSSGGVPSIGRSIDNLKALVLGRQGELSPPGVPGELCIGGRGLARGYLGAPGLTAERFVPDPFGPPGSRLYRTGDLVRSVGGELQFLGRIDGQVKVRGVRIETGEVEAALARHPGVREAAVLAREERGGERHLAAWYVAAEGPVPAPELRAFLRRTLPEAMVPSAFAVLPALPRTAHGKIDRRALQRIEPAAADETGEAPRTPAEELVAGIWAGLLGVERVSLHDSFFELGGHSLLAGRMMARLRGALGLELPLSTLFEEPTVAGLAAAFERARGAASGEELPLAPVPRGGDLPL
ncbi:MAG TPA: amino acid adenylation domain-containing protein, partial [Thermoanaerobaculia bacterium]|nr:amino acid adenylation domain-containing protein [Thermoanaerobaculia bacterium]